MGLGHMLYNLVHFSARDLVALPRTGNYTNDGHASQLSYNVIGSTGVSRFSATLVKLTQLASLNLSYNDIGLKGKILQSYSCRNQSWTRGAQ
jgi:hypothetical protein